MLGVTDRLKRESELMVKSAGELTVAAATVGGAIGRLTSASTALEQANAAFKDAKGGLKDVKLELTEVNSVLKKVCGSLRGDRGGTSRKRQREQQGADADQVLIVFISFR